MRDGPCPTMSRLCAHPSLLVARLATNLLVHRARDRATS